MASANWYKVGRVALGMLSSPAVFDSVFRELIADGMLVEVTQDGEPLARLLITEKGHAALRASSR